MKKSCLEKELKLVTTKNVGVLNDTGVKKRLREDQNEINSKLLESGIEYEELSWVEKKSLLKTINVSLSLVNSEVKQNSSASLSKVNFPTSAKWIGNSFEISKKNDIISKTNQDNKNIKTNQEDTNQAISFKSDNLVENNFKKKPGSNNNISNLNENIQESSKKLSKKVHYIKIQFEGTSKEECNILLDSGKSKEPFCGKKRASPLNKYSDLSKKPKMEQLDNNEINSEENNILNLELELQKRRKNIPFKRRDIKALVAECEFKNKKWKETFSKYSSPTHWGIPIVKNCSHKWDGKQIPQKLLQRYQKYLLSKNLYHPLYLPNNFQNNKDCHMPKSESLSSSNSNSSETPSDKAEINFSKDAVSREEEDETKISDLDSFKPSTSHENGGRMVLRNRNQYKPVVVDDNECSTGPDDSEEWSYKQKSAKKLKNNSKIKKLGILNNQQLIIKLEKCNINKNLELKTDGSFSSSTLMMNDSKQINTNNLKVLPDPDTMVCPICSLRFKKQLIESHATECASKTYKD